MVGAECINILSKMFVHQSERAGRGARGDAPGLFWDGLRREIGKSMPSGGIRLTVSNWVIKAIKWEINYQNGTFNQF